MNKDWELSLENIDDEEREMKQVMRYYGDWMAEKANYRQKFLNRNDKGWEKCLFADDTYRNIRIGVCGFFSYAREALNMNYGSERLQYVPALNSNQSNLEGFFSKVRHMHHDTVSRYPTAVAANNSRASAKVSVGNKQYPSSTMVDESINTKSYNFVVGQQLKPRRKKWRNRFASGQTHLVMKQ
jgi:hypothetical protein